MATSYIRSDEVLIAQYSVRKYSGREFFIYATPGGAIDITWKRMSFNNDLEDLIQYYYVNGVLFNRPKNAKLYCSSFSSLYILYGQAMNWFHVPYASESSHFLLKQLSLFETHFTECAGSSVFGIHTVEYFRPVYDKKSGSYVLREVQHPDTLYVLPDLAYFYKMDNVSKAKKKEIIQNFVYKCWNRYGRSVLQPIRKMILGQPIDEISEQCSAVRCSSSYSCYVFCGHSDRDSVYDHLVVPQKQLHKSMTG